MALKDYIKDITTYVTPTGFFDKIKVTATAKEISLNAADKDNDIVLFGTFNKPLSDLSGEFGLSNLSLLQTITGDPEFNNKETTMTVTYEDRNGEQVPAEIAYVNKSKSHINYRFMGKNLLPEKPKFNEPKWDVVIKPGKAQVQQLIWAANGLSAYEQYFIPKVVDGELKLFIGEEDAKTQRGGVVLASDLTESLDTQYSWKIAHIAAPLKMADACDCEMAFSVKGAIQIKLSTGIGVYRYVFPAKVR